MLRAVQQALDDGLARPILIGRRDVVAPPHRAAQPAASRSIEDVELVDPQTIRAIHEYWRSITS